MKIYYNSIPGRLGNELIAYMVIRNNYENYEFYEIKINDKILPLIYKENKNTKNIIENKICSIHGIQQLPNLNNNYNNFQINLTGWFQRYEYIQNIEIKNEIYNAFNFLQKIKPINEFIIHIRSGDQWIHNKPNRDAVQSGQPILPISFYKNILKNNTLPVRFVCENLNDKYIKELQKQFKYASFQSTNVLNDFITLLGAKKLALSISTFSWCGCYLNNYAEEFYFPLDGMFHHNYGKDIHNNNEREYTNFIITNDNRINYINLVNGKIKKWMGNENDFNYVINN